MNKQEAIEEVTELFGDSIEAKAFRNIIRKLHKPQKVTIPKFVAEWIEEAKEGECSLCTAFGLVDGDSRNFDWLFNGDKSNQDTFARAWLDGYEIEKEQLYTVEIPNPESDSLTVLEKLDDGTVVISQMDDFPVDWRNHAEYQLTEQEIRKNFEWSWQFAKPVEEN